MSERNRDGTFAPGHRNVSPGRPSKARELAYLAIAREVVTLDKWRQILRKAVEDAGECKDPVARNQARRFLAEYLIGKPAQSIRIRDDRDPFEEFDRLSDEELERIAGITDDGEGDPRREAAPEE